jgi:hypothetical protein
MSLLPRTTTFRFRGVALTVTPSDWTVKPPRMLRSTYDECVTFLGDAIGTASLIELLATEPSLDELRGLIYALRQAARFLAPKAEPVGGRP